MKMLLIILTLVPLSYCGRHDSYRVGTRVWPNGSVDCGIFMNDDPLPIAVWFPPSGTCILADAPAPYNKLREVKQ